jgi:hypothetical protein
MLMNTAGRFSGLIVSLCLLASLGACGGGGGGDGTDPPVTVDPPVIPSDLPGGVSNFQAADLRSYQSGGSGSGSGSSALSIVDLRTGREVRHLVLSTSTSGRQWTATERFAALSDTRIQSLGAAQVLYVNQGQLMQLSLLGDSLGSPVAMGGLKDVCAINGESEVDIAGAQVWVEVLTAGADGLCSGQGDNVRQWVAAGIPNAATGLLASGATGKTLVSSLWSTVQSPPSGMLVLDAADGTLGVYSLDLKTRLSTVAIGRKVASDEPIDAYPRLPGANARLLLRVGKSLFVAEVSGSALNIVKAIRTLQDSGSGDSAQDASEAFIADGANLIGINANGDVRTVAKLDAALGRVGMMYIDSGRIVLEQSMSVSPYTSTISAIRTSDGAASTLLASDASHRVGIEAVRDGQAWLSRTLNNDDTTDVIRIQLDGTGRTTVASQAVHVHPLFATHFDLGGAGLVDSLLWCQASSAEPHGCEDQNVVRYGLADGQTATLGQVKVDAGWSYDYLGSDVLTPSDRPFVMSIEQSRSDKLASGLVQYAYSNKLVWLNPRQSGTLKPVTLLP